MFLWFVHILQIYRSIERLMEEEVKVDQNSDSKKFTDKFKCSECRELEAEALKRLFMQNVNTLRKGDADLRFYITTVQDG